MKRKGSGENTGATSFPNIKPEIASSFRVKQYQKEHNVLVFTASSIKTFGSNINLRKVFQQFCFFTQNYIHVIFCACTKLEINRHHLCRMFIIISIPKEGRSLYGNKWKYSHTVESDLSFGKGPYKPHAPKPHGKTVTDPRHRQGPAFAILPLPFFALGQQITFLGLPGLPRF